MINSAQKCRDNGWEAGTQLAGDEGYGDGETVIEITAVGEEHVLAKTISHRGVAALPGLDLEGSWYLGDRDWRKHPLASRVTITRMTSPSYDGDKWGVRKSGGVCLSVDGEWEYEPMPSDRSPKFHKRCRFDSLEEAVKAARKVEHETREYKALPSSGTITPDMMEGK